MRILFSVGNFGFLRNFEPALRLLAERGHDIHLVADRKDSVGGTKTVDRLIAAYPGRFTHAYAPAAASPWQALATTLRLSLDYWRYLDPAWDHSPSLRARAAKQVPPMAVRVPQLPIAGSRAAMGLLRRVTSSLEHAVPPSPGAVQLLRDHRPDLLLLTPLLYFGSQQVDYVRAARALGIRTVLGVGSWDHLTTKGLIHEAPDRVLVWNEMQRREAAELHGIDPARVIVTGAQAYDPWFVQTPSVSRAGFCARVGLPADRPMLLYLCSSPFITPYEVGFVTRWIAAVRAADDPDVRRASILIRPHPQNAEQWRDFDASSLDAVAVWPRAGANPVDQQARDDYFDSMSYSVAVVGVNTSALIESGIVGRPVFTVLTEDFAGQQEGTLHFQHLKNVNGGLLHVAATLDEHTAQLGRALRGEYDPSKGRAFIEAFIRPRGLDSPAGAHFADAIEATLAEAAPHPVTAPLSVHVRRIAMRPMATMARAAARRRQQRRAASRSNAAAPGRPLRILFTVASPEYLRYYDSTMKLLADRGHAVAVAVNSLRERKHARLDLIDDDRIEIAGVVPGRGDLWAPFARAVRGTMDFVRYLDPRFADTPVLRHRMYRKVLPVLLRPLNVVRSLSSASVGRVMRMLQSVERAVPVSRAVGEFLDARKPDVVIVSPLVDAASDQVDTVRAARAVGIAAIAGIASWDNLTNKGHLRVEPDLVTVWNEHQKREAVEFHGISPERVAVTGAQLFDRWFDREPSTDRDAFCRHVGLPDARPFVLFTGSSVFIARSEFEVPFVRRWIAALRASSDPVLRDAAVLVRPHPFNPVSWITADFSDLGPVAIWPRARYTPAAEDARTSLFDSLYHCQAVVGINTSAMIEAAILGKPVLSILSPEFAGTQDGTLHFRYLRPENGGFLRVAESIDEHLPQLAAVLRDPALVRAETERFVATFVRPHGLTSACTPILADTIERAGWTAGAAAPQPGASSLLLRIAAWPLAAAMHLADTDVRARDVAGRVRKATREGAHRSQSAAGGVLKSIGRALRRGPRIVLRNLRLARYYIATVVLQRPAK